MTLKFKCPKCSSNRLECCEDGPYVSEVLVIDKDGDFEWGEINASGDVVRFQCLQCGFTLKDNFGEPLINHEEVVKWIEEHCPQE